jgi:hypothetical protein
MSNLLVNPLTKHQDFSTIKLYGQNLGLAIIGFIAWSTFYGLSVYYRDYLVTYLRSFEERGYYYKLLEIRPTLYRALFFTMLMAVFWTSIFLMDTRLFIIVTGFILFALVYLIFFYKHYIMEQNEIDLFDDYYYLFQKVFKRKTDGLKNKLD